MKFSTTIKFCNLCITVVNLLATYVWCEETLEYKIKEELPAATEVGNIRRDAYIGIHGNPAGSAADLRFGFLSKNGLHVQYFVLDEASGVLATRKKIDRDEICPRSTECVIPVDIAIRPRQYFQIIKVSVYISDINDNHPQFPQGTIQLSIPEGKAPGSKFIVPSARDPDSKQYGIQGYELMPTSGSFRLQVTETGDKYNVRLILSERLDRETTASYNMKIIAFDGGSPRNSGSVQVYVTVSDVNDNDPVFEKESYHFYVYENTTKHTTIARVSARDPDAGLNGQILYSFAPDTSASHGNMFSIRNTTGEIYLEKTPSYQLGSVYHLTVMAHDRGPGSLPAAAKVIIRIFDINDHPPQITLNILGGGTKVKISETASRGSFLAHVSVQDGDAGNNGKVNCSVSNPLFKIQQLSGKGSDFKIVTNAAFDRETEFKYQLKFTCQDHGKPPLSSVIEFEVIILDENDNAPLFSDSTFSATVKENSPPGVKILQVNATDKDMGQNREVYYALQNSAQKCIDIDQVTGVLTTRVSFDHEKTPDVVLQVLALDRGSPQKTSTATILVTIGDLNDMAPTFPRPTYAFGVFENERINTEVGRVFANDPDSEPYNQHFFSFKDAGSGDFVIDPVSGRIKTNKVLDREAKSEYHLVVRVSDKLDPTMTSTANISIYVADRNDNNPQIDFPNSQNNTVFMSNQVPLGYTVVKIEAQDIDSGGNARLKYGLKGTSDLFQIDQYTGIISVNSDLRNHDEEVFDLVVHVEDHGFPPKVSESGLHVVVNKSIAMYHSSVSHIISGQSLLIVLVLAGALGFMLVILLIVVLILVKRRSSQRRKRRYISENLVRVTQRQAAEKSPGLAVKRRLSADERLHLTLSQDTYSTETMPEELGHSGTIPIRTRSSRPETPGGYVRTPSSTLTPKRKRSQSSVGRRNSPAPSLVDVSRSARMNINPDSTDMIIQESRSRAIRPVSRDSDSISSPEYPDRGYPVNSAQVTQDTGKRRNNFEAYKARQDQAATKVEAKRYMQATDAEKTIPKRPISSNQNMGRKPRRGKRSGACTHSQPADDADSDASNQNKVAMVYPQPTDGQFDEGRGDKMSPSDSCHGFCGSCQGDTDAYHGMGSLRFKEVDSDAENRQTKVLVLKPVPPPPPPPPPLSLSVEHADERRRPLRQDFSGNATTSSGSFADDTDFYDQNDFDGHDIIV